MRFFVCRFNPRPALEPGATAISNLFALKPGVSILARLWSRALHEVRFLKGRAVWVSILARLWSRALHLLEELAIRYCYVSILARLWSRALLKSLSLSSIFREFQSSPGFGAGRYALVIPHLRAYLRFNPRPALEPGATARIISDNAKRYVSILARLWSRALRR